MRACLQYVGADETKAGEDEKLSDGALEPLRSLL